MALKVKNPKKNLADILIEKERLNESYDSSSAVSLKTLEQSAEGEGAAEKAEDIANKAAAEENRPIESTKIEEQVAPIPVAKQPAQTQPEPQNQAINPIGQHTTTQPVTPIQPTSPVQPATAPTPEPIPVPVPQAAPIKEERTYYQQGVGEGVRRPIQERKPWEEVDDYNPPRKKRGRPYQGYSENTHVQSIYVRNDLYEYIMINYVGHGRKHTSFNKFVNAAINNYLR